MFLKSSSYSQLAMFVLGMHMPHDMTLRWKNRIKLRLKTNVGGCLSHEHRKLCDDRKWLCDQFASIRFSCNVKQGKRLGILRQTEGNFGLSCCLTHRYILDYRRGCTKGGVGLSVVHQQFITTSLFHVLSPIPIPYPSERPGHDNFEDFPSFVVIYDFVQQEWSMQRILWVWNNWAWQGGRTPWLTGWPGNFWPNWTVC